ncbi:MAG: TIGR01777 family oxidoreductase [Chthoniobacterales bacterium]
MIGAMLEPAQPGSAPSRRIILAGGSGFLGSNLSEMLLRGGHEVVVLTRSATRSRGGIRFVQWDGKSLGAWAAEVEGARALINLTGKSINCRHTPDARREIINSRINSVHVLGQAIAACAAPPPVFVQVSGIGYYGDIGDRIVDESARLGDGFMAEVCRQWEAAFNTLSLPQTRKALLRIGVVLGREGGALKTLGTLTRWGLGGSAGSGDQYLSWIHLQDLMQMFTSLVERADCTGVFDGTAPNPVTNREFMRELRRVLHRPWSPPAPAPLVRLGAWAMGTEPDLALSSCRAVPRHFLERGFDFRYANLRPALENLYEMEHARAA